MLSVIIPTYNEENQIAGCLESLVSQEGEFEIILVDGGSADRTLEIAKSFSNIKILKSEKGRARQMNYGASQAKGQVLWFVHADSKVSPGSLQQINEAQAGAFRFAIDDSGFLFRLIEWGTRIRSEIFKVPYGDQGIFVNQQLFKELGGFDDSAPMEDLYLVRKLRQATKLKIIKFPLLTSSRKWREKGIFCTACYHWWIIIQDWLR